MEENKIFTWKIGGRAGQGQQAAGLLFSKSCTRAGYYAFSYSEFPSLIRGGHVTSAVSVSKNSISAIYQKVDMLLALNAETIKRHVQDLSKQGVILFDSDSVKKQDLAGVKKKTFALPLATLLKEHDLKPIVSNVVAVGASFGLLGFNFQIFRKSIQEIFKKKGEAIVEMNIKAAEAGFVYAHKHFRTYHYPFSLDSKTQTKGKYILTSNEAVALGAVASGCRLYVAYPMSPSSSILHNIAAWSRHTGMVVHQPEDEIAGIHAMIGGMFMGTRSMISTSGGGFALMSEGLTLSAMTETPAVICVCSRPGPATGLPTWTEQGDLKFVVNAGHGDFPRIVLAPSEPQEAFQFTSLAFNLAEKYQMPVFILMDKYLSESQQSFDTFDTRCTVQRGKLLEAVTPQGKKEYQRYANVKDGVSPRTIPGVEHGTHLANSDEHDEFGYAIEGWHEPMREIQVEKRARKLDIASKELPLPRLYGPKTARVTLLGWGSTKGPVLEAMRQVGDINYIHVPAVWPIYEAAFTEILKGVHKLVALENNQSGQFTKLLRAETGIHPHAVILKYDGRQFWPEELVEKLKKL